MYIRYSPINKEAEVDLLYFCFFNCFYRLQRNGRIEVIPPLGIVLKPLGKPCKHGICPTDFTVVFQNKMVLSGKLDKLYGTP